MVTYWIRASYASPALKAEHRTRTVADAIQKCRGRLIGSWLTQADMDCISILELPDDVVLEDFLRHLCAEDGCASVETVRLLNP